MNGAVVKRKATLARKKAAQQASAQTTGTKAANKTDPGTGTSTPGLKSDSD